MATVDVVCITYNSAPHIERCLDSLSVTTNDLSLIVRDNSSTDNTLEVIESSHPDLEIIHGDNVGFARAVNPIIEHGDGDFVLLLNPDCELEPEALDGMVDFLRQNPAYGACGPRVLNVGAPTKTLTAGFQPRLLTLLSHAVGLAALGLSKGLYVYEGRIGKQPIDVEWVGGACILIRRSALEQVGLLSERWFMYSEDLEICDRIIKGGWTIALLPRLVAHHVGGASHGDAKRAIQVAWLVTLLQHCESRNNYGRASMLIARLSMSAGYLGRFLVNCARQNYDGARSNWAWARGCWKLEP